jgi:hypothetical protein
MEVARKCGSCSLCCKLPYVQELAKPMDTWCPHAKPGHGCSIYPDRPESCRHFVCAWVTSAVGDEWFPARCKMMIVITDQGMMVSVDPTYPNAWRREPYHAQLLNWARDIRVGIRVGVRFFGLNPDGTEAEVTRTRAWIEGRSENPP